MEIEKMTERLLTLEKKTGYVFNDRNLLLSSMLHSSYVNEKNIPGLRSNERLEFLGDAALSLIISEYLMTRYPSHDEGFLSLRRSFLVREHSLARIARKLRLHRYIFIGRGEEKYGDNRRDSLLSDALEAYIGAVYTDGGLEAARRMVLDFFSFIFDDVDSLDTNFNFKNQLQEYVQNHFRCLPEYRLARQYGPEHRRKFRVHVYVGGRYVSFGTGTSIKKAEHTASRNAFNRYKRQEQKKKDDR